MPEDEDRDMRADRQTNRQTYRHAYAYRTTLHRYQRRSNTTLDNGERQDRQTSRRVDTSP